MAVTFTVTPAAPTAAADFCRIDVAGLSLNDPTTFDAGNSPSMDEVRYYLEFEVGGEVVGRSQRFACNADGEWTFDNYMFPEAGTYTIHARLDADDSSAGSDTVVVA